MPEKTPKDKAFLFNKSQITMLERPDGHALAYASLKGCAPGVVWLGGFKSDMQGSKALAVEDWARRQGRSFVRFDYFGHGLSSGAFREGSLSRWRADVLAMLDEVVQGPVVLAGSSMGGWLALLAALARLGRVRGLVLVAPAPDFTEKLMWDRFSEDDRQTLMHEGVMYQPSAYDDEPYEITRLLIEDGRQNLLLDKPVLPLHLPVHMLHGQCDCDVPWAYALRLLDRIDSDDVAFTLIKGGDHRLSRPQDLQRLTRAVEDMCRKAEDNAVC